MRLRTPIGFIIGVLLLVNQCQAFNETYTVKFHVVDAKGASVVGAELSTRFIIDGSFEGESFIAFPGQPAVTDDAGMAEVVFQDYGSQHGLLGYTTDRKSGGFVIVERQDEDKTLEIIFHPTVEVSAEYQCSELGAAPGWTNTLITPKGLRGYVFEFRSMDGKIKFPLPRGKWDFTAYGSDIKKEKRDFIIDDHETPVELGVIDFTPTAMAKLIGKPAPKLEILDARGVGKDFQLSDYKGKWVLIEFWGYW